MNQDLKDLQDKIKSFQDESDSAKQSKKEKSSKSGSNIGIRAGAELVVPIFVAGFIGYHLDNWTGMKPLFLIIFLLLGMGTGFWNVYKINEMLDSDQVDDDTEADKN